MKKKYSLQQIAAVLMATAVFSACSPAEPVEVIDPAAEQERIEKELIAANDQLYSGLNAMFQGDFEPLSRLWSHGDYITYMGPFGGTLTGWEEVKAEFEQVTSLKLGGKISSADLHVYAGNDMGYTVCVEVGENISEDGTPVAVSHRATNIFHLEDGKWRLVHHHTDISQQLEEAFDVETE